MSVPDGLRSSLTASGERHQPLRLVHAVAGEVAILAHRERRAPLLFAKRVIRKAVEWLRSSLTASGERHPSRLT